MKKIVIGLVDYGVGNHASLTQALGRIGFRYFISGDPSELSVSDIILLPGVGAFAPAMKSMRSSGLDVFLQDVCASNKPIVGICLGMQLLGRSSTEDCFTVGLNLIPGDVVSMRKAHSSIGWNSIINVGSDPLFMPSNEQDFYFNHSYAFEAEDTFTMCCSEVGGFKFASAVRVNNVVGMQFHPEKSQQAGRNLLHAVISGLCNA